MLRLHSDCRARANAFPVEELQEVLIAFEYAGDLWVVSRSGGQAIVTMRRLPGRRPHDVREI